MIRRALVILATLLLAGCHHTAKPGPASTYCQIARPITWAAADTRITKQQIDAHNRTWKRLCRKTRGAG